MSKSRGALGLAMIVLCAGLAASPAQAAERQSAATAWLDGLVRAAGVWVAELSGLRAPAPHALTAARGGSDATTPPPPPDTNTLKQHVDNPGQTAMK
jgi:hypothetical protein